MSDLREAFEAWVQSTDGSSPSDFSKIDGEYADPCIQAYWMGWQAALSANGGEKFKLLPSVRDYLYEGISDSVNSEDECPDYEFAYQLGQIVEHYSPAPPSVAVLENDIKARALEEYANQLDVVFANAQEAGATDCPAWHAGQFAKDARKQAARLRASQQEGGER